MPKLKTRRARSWQREAMPEAAVPNTAAEGENEIQASALSTRAKNALVKNGITTWLSFKALSNEEISNLSGLGEKTIKEILEFLGR